MTDNRGIWCAEIVLDNERKKNPESSSEIFEDLRSSPVLVFMDSELEREVEGEFECCSWTDSSSSLKCSWFRRRVGM